MDVSIYELDFRPLVVEDNPGGVFEALKDTGRFQHVRGNYALIWPTPETDAYDEQAIDTASEGVRFFCEKHSKPLRVSAKDKASPLPDSGRPGGTVGGVGEPTALEQKRYG